MQYNTVSFTFINKLQSVKPFTRFNLSRSEDKHNFCAGISLCLLIAGVGNVFGAASITKSLAYTEILAILYPQHDGFVRNGYGTVPGC